MWHGRKTVEQFTAMPIERPGSDTLPVTYRLLSTLSTVFEPELSLILKSMVTSPQYTEGQYFSSPSETHPASESNTSV